MLKLSELTKLIKSFARNSAISDEEFLNAFLFPFVIAGNIKNKNGEEFRLDKARTSKIVNQKDDVPTKLREALSIYGIADKTREGIPVFVEDYLDPAKCEVLLERLLEMSRQELNKKCDPTEAGKMDLLSDLLTELLLMSLSESNVSPPDTILIWKHGINSVEVQTGDLFRYGFENRHKKKNIVVIPVNTAFDTHVTRKIENDPYPVVSENTVHGQWLVRMKESGEQLEQIDIRITKSLENGGFLPVSDSKNKHGKTICYPIGSVAVIETNNAIYFLMAMAQFDDYNNARSSSADIDKALASLLNVYDRVGLGYDLYLPLMGTGLSRAGLSIQESYDLLTGGLIRNGSKIHGHIHLVLRPEDKKEIEIKEVV